jgi:hypothetical protein
MGCPATVATASPEVACGADWQKLAFGAASNSGKHKTSGEIFIDIVSLKTDEPAPSFGAEGRPAGEASGCNFNWM